jgi:hypothetical protein
MGRPPRRRYALEHPDLDPLVDELVERARQEYGEGPGEEFARQIVVTALRLLRDRTYPGDVKLINSSLKELRHAFRVFAPYKHVRKVTVFGSARTRSDHPDWKQAFAFAERMAHEGWMIITGAGPGIMRAANGGAGRRASFGVNIRLPYEQAANEVIAGDSKLVNFRYFFTRKVVFVKESHAIALFPGGFGTHDEGFEALTLVQTGKSQVLPIVFVDAPGGSYWRDWEGYVQTHLRSRGLISASDLSLFKVTDDVDVAVQELLSFYNNYDSSRYVGDLLVIRVRRAPGPEALEALNAEFADIVSSGRIEVQGPLPREAGEVPQFPRVTLAFNRRDVGRLRQLVDRLNALVADHAPAGEASPREVLEQALPPEAERAEEAE